MHLQHRAEDRDDAHQRHERQHHHHQLHREMVASARHRKHEQDQFADERDAAERDDHERDGERRKSSRSCGVIAIELRKFWAEEAPSYRGEVIIAAEVRDKGGRRLWGKEIVAGQGDNTGRSLSVVNYNETLSDATRRMMGTLLGNPAFMKALTR